MGVAVMVMAVSASLMLAGCGPGYDEDEMLTSEQLTEDRQDNIDLVHGLATEIITETGNDVERVTQCSDTGPAELKYGVYTRTGPAADGAQEFVENEWGPRLEADGWTVRDDENLEDLDRSWAKNGRSVSVVIGGSERTSVVITALTSCGIAEEIDPGRTSPDDPWFLEPRSGG